MCVCLFFLHKNSKHVKYNQMAVHTSEINNMWNACHVVMLLKAHK